MNGMKMLRLEVKEELRTFFGPSIILPGSQVIFRGDWKSNGIVVSITDDVQAFVLWNVSPEMSLRSLYRAQKQIQNQIDNDIIRDIVAYGGA